MLNIFPFILICLWQFEREKGLKTKVISKIKIENEEDISEEVVGSTLKRALRSYSTLQTEDGFWPGDYGGPLFLLPGLVTFPPFTTSKTNQIACARILRMIYFC